MAKIESINRYSLIIKKLRQKPSSFNEILSYLEFESELQDFNFRVSLRTFQRDINDIRTLYKIDIQFNKSTKNYFIEYDEQNEFVERILEAFDTFNALSISDRLSDYIHFEKHRPKGTENLYFLLKAIKKNFQIKFIYQKFGNDERTIRTVNPYALKEFKNRWYLVAKDTKDEYIKTFGLDRLYDLEITKKQFDLPVDFSVKDHFRYCFGIEKPFDTSHEEIILEFDYFQAKYVKSMPLHSTQQIIQDDENGLILKFEMYVTHDLVMEILSMGEYVKVIKPNSLIEKIKNSHTNAFKQY